MAQKFAYPNTESELQHIQEQLYAQTKQATENQVIPRFKGLLEIISSEVTILTAIHNIKGNKGSKTPGTDGEKIQEHILEKEYREVIKRVQESFRDYKPGLIRREWIPKPGKTEKRPLGIPTIIDRIIQECVRIVIEPIMEAQFFNHSYGFRPMRDTRQALARVANLIHDTGYYWIIEGDISKYFDTINHRLLLQKLWNMGIRDQRVLMIIKQMLNAGIMNELKETKEGTPQGGILSPLLANVYLHIFDYWVTREWETKQTRRKYQKSTRIAALKRTKLKPTYLIRYADDWVLITNTRENALKWKQRIAKYLRTNLKLKLSEEKTKITNITKRPIHFLGFQIKYVPGKARKGFVARIRPEANRLVNKVNELRQNIRQLRNAPSKKDVINKINIINSQIRGIIQYYEAATYVNIDLSKQQFRIEKVTYNTLKRFGAKLKPANQTNNLRHIHTKYTKKIAAIEHDGYQIAITSLTFCRWKAALPKDPTETPYTVEGRAKHRKRTGRAPPLLRDDAFLSKHLTERIALGQIQQSYNFEYFMNRAYAFNRDQGKCRVCRNNLYSWYIEIHYIRPFLPQYKVNKVNNLACVCKTCHDMIHSSENYAKLGMKIWNRIRTFREKLKKTINDNDGTPDEIKVSRPV